MSISYKAPSQSQGWMLLFISFFLTGIVLVCKLSAPTLLYLNEWLQVHSQLLLNRTAHTVEESSTAGNSCVPSAVVSAWWTTEALHLYVNADGRGQESRFLIHH